MTDRRVVLHVGLAKTGTTALQLAFVRNKEWLADRGIHYPDSRTDHRAARGRVVNGNAVDLLNPYLAPREADPAAADAALSATLATLDTRPEHILFSSEALYRFNPDRLRHFREQVSSRGGTLQVALFVRNIAGHAWSAYLQFVKRRGYTDTFTTYIAGSTGRRPDYNVRLAARLSVLHDILGPMNVRVLHYDTHRLDLVATFLGQVLDVNSLQGFELPSATANRSLTRAELEYVRYLNTRAADPADARRLSDALVAYPPLGDVATGFAEDDLKTLYDRFAHEVEWVNARHFPDGRLKVGGEVGTGGGEGLSAGEQRLLDLLLRAASA